MQDPMRYDGTELMAGRTEVLCCGTAVVVEPAASNSQSVI